MAFTCPHTPTAFTDAPDASFMIWRTDGGTIMLFTHNKQGADALPC
jgi:hypothetical protein